MLIITNSYYLLVGKQLVMLINYNKSILHFDWSKNTIFHVQHTFFTTFFLASACHHRWMLSGRRSGAVPGVLPPEDAHLVRQPSLGDAGALGVRRVEWMKLWSRGIPMVINVYV